MLSRCENISHKRMADSFTLVHFHETFIPGLVVAKGGSFDFVSPTERYLSGSESIQSVQYSGTFSLLSKNLLQSFLIQL